jgi:hypothetical protein
MTYKTLRCPEQIVHTDTKADLLDDPIGILRIDIVLYGDPAVLLKLSWGDLYQIGNLGLWW